MRPRKFSGQRHLSYRKYKNYDHENQMITFRCKKSKPQKRIYRECTEELFYALLSTTERDL